MDIAETQCDFSGLLASRICHDLINPLGAIGNGVELLGLERPALPELAFLTEGVTQATVLVRFFRFAFGPAGASDATVPGDLAALVAQWARQTRLEVMWDPRDCADRREAKMGCLALLCAQLGLPLGGQLHGLRSPSGGYRLTGRGRRVDLDPSLWQWILQPEVDGASLTGRSVQFGLFARELRAAGRRARLERLEDGFILSW